MRNLLFNIWCAMMYDWVVWWWWWWWWWWWLLKAGSVASCTSSLNVERAHVGSLQSFITSMFFFILESFIKLTNRNVCSVVDTALDFTCRNQSLTSIRFRFEFGTLLWTHAHFKDTQRYRFSMHPFSLSLSHTHTFTLRHASTRPRSVLFSPH